MKTFKPIHTPLVALAALTVVGASVPLTAFAAGDHAFLKKAQEGDNSETALGNMAARKGASEGTRAFGKMLATDHTKGKAQAVAVAKAEGAPVTDDMAPEAKAEATKLQGLSGPAFDREFARYMVQDHKTDISDFEKQAANGDKATADLARQTLPVLRKHLATAEHLADVAK